MIATQGHADPPGRFARIVAAIGLAVALALLTVSIAAGDWSAGHAPLPFVWRDVALAHLACAAPLAWWLSRAVCRRLPSALAVLAAVVVFGLSILPAALGDMPTQALGAFVIRIAMALGLTLWAMIVGRVLIGFRGDNYQTSGSGRRLAMAALGLAALAAAPSVYVHARCRHDLVRLGEYLEQGRIGEARPLAHAILALDAQAQWRGQPLAKVSAGIDDEVRKIEALVRTPLPLAANAEVRLQRARQLAMLGQTEQALAVLPTFGDPLRAADADNLRGTIHEARGDWAAAIGCFQRAHDACADRPQSVERTALLVRAATGLAYNQRKAGDYIAADKSYQELLAIAPNADTHFLLAQFYEDAQNAGKARQHARRAIALDPARYQADGDKLIRKLAVFQFGCLRAFGG